MMKFFKGQKKKGYFEKLKKKKLDATYG